LAPYFQQAISKQSQNLKALSSVFQRPWIKIVSRIFPMCSKPERLSLHIFKMAL
jgi:hypothetical protein